MKKHIFLALSLSLAHYQTPFAMMKGSQEEASQIIDIGRCLEDYDFDSRHSYFQFMFHDQGFFYFLKKQYPNQSNHVILKALYDFLRSKFQQESLSALIYQDDLETATPLQKLMWQLGIQRVWEKNDDGEVNSFLTPFDLDVVVKIDNALKGIERIQALVEKGKQLVEEARNNVDKAPRNVDKAARNAKAFEQMREDIENIANASILIGKEWAIFDVKFDDTAGIRIRSQTLTGEAGAVLSLSPATSGWATLFAVDAAMDDIQGALDILEEEKMRFSLQSEIIRTRLNFGVRE